MTAINIMLGKPNDVSRLGAKNIYMADVKVVVATTNSVIA